VTDIKKAQEVCFFKKENQNLSWAQIGEHFEITGQAARGLWRYWNASFEDKNFGETPDGKTTYEPGFDQIFFPDKKEVEEISWREFVATAQVNKDLGDRLKINQKTAQVEIKTDKPIGVLYTGDWHLGDGATDYASWLQMIHKFMEHPRLYMCDLGDAIQNMRVFKDLETVFEQVLNPNMQAYMMKSIVKELDEKNKVIARVRGNHDFDFDTRQFGSALQMYYYQTIKSPVFDNKGLLKLKVGEETYEHLLFHKGRGGGGQRPAGNAFNEFKNAFPAEVVAGGHDHRGAFEYLSWYTLDGDPRRDTFLIKCGTYQTDSRYGNSFFPNGGTPFMPVVIFWPNYHQKMFVPDIDMAITILESFK
jgi:hypothetical protein